METITQTNRTILFAEINPERLNLLTLVGDVRGKSSLDAVSYTHLTLPTNSRV